MVAYDATGGGVMTTTVGGAPLVVPGKPGSTSYIVAYALDGISVNEVTITCAQETEWDAAGFSLKPTGNGTATGRCRSIQTLNNPIPITAGRTLVLTGTSGANPMLLIVYITYDGGSWKPRLSHNVGAPKRLLTRASAASGVNLTAYTIQTGLITLATWPNKAYEPVEIAPDAAFTTTPIIGIRKLNEGDWFFVMLPLTDVAQLWDPIMLPYGVLDGPSGPLIHSNDTLEIAWLSATAEQPTGKLSFAY